MRLPKRSKFRYKNYFQRLFEKEKPAKLKPKAMSKLVDLDNNAYRTFQKLVNDGGDSMKAPPSFLNGEAHFQNQTRIVSLGVSC